MTSRIDPRVPDLDPAAPGERSACIDRDQETRNLLVLAVHQVLWRIGWTFKTESILVPAILDSLHAAGWLRGFLPLLSRLGQSVPPLFCVGLVRDARHKKSAFAVVAALASLPYLVLAGVWALSTAPHRAALVLTFLAVHFAFFVIYGLYQVASGTLQGKLIRPTRRGQLLWGATFWGLFPTVLLCQWLLPGWLAAPWPGFAYLFLFVALAFALSALVVCALAEPADEPARVPSRPGSLAESLHMLRRNRNLRRLILVVPLFGLGLVTIPHYQAFARDRLGLANTDFVLMVITHTTAVSVYSLLVGPLADRCGYRLTLRLLILGAALAPAYVLWLPAASSQLGKSFFWLVFVPLALAPLVPTVIVNYALELGPPAEHARYVSLVNFAMMPPYLLSPLVGRLVDVARFETVAAATIVLMLLCGAMTFWLDEPRKGKNRP